MRIKEAFEQVCIGAFLVLCRSELARETDAAQCQSLRVIVHREQASLLRNPGAQGLWHFSAGEKKDLEFQGLF
ncbi:hypothetical protein [Pseudomonas chlororaphis]|uniref:hypothetical protein n=1 Tax=Pseudomonas chlororaphis TaxID=587753 RepID=UPI002368E038|nr:hypothetical protein [Pseudomonas chlororaphis]WDH34316.1 hypothetical protein PUP62_26345 [Pseudomonas chlororaphis]WDH40400.1 hypothetical protein PUP51_26345 [Pseudomonas chlororaphis]